MMHDACLVCLVEWAWSKTLMEKNWRKSQGDFHRLSFSSVLLLSGLHLRPHLYAPVWEMFSSLSRFVCFVCLASHALMLPLIVTFPFLAEGAGWLVEQHVPVQSIARLQRGIRLPGHSTILGYERVAVCGASACGARGWLLPSL